MQTATISAQKPLPASWRGIHFRGTAAGQLTEASLAGISTLDPPDLIQYKHGSVSGTTKTPPALSGSLISIPHDFSHAAMRSRSRYKISEQSICSIGCKSDSVFFCSLGQCHSATMIVRIARVICHILYKQVKNHPAQSLQRPWGAQLTERARLAGEGERVRPERERVRHSV